MKALAEGEAGAQGLAVPRVGLTRCPIALDHLFFSHCGRFVGHQLDTHNLRQALP